MRRSPWTRILSALFAVWLALVMGEAGFVHHHCPMHDGPLPAAASGGMAAHGAHGGHDHGAPNGSHHACTCLGTCNASSVVALAGAAEVPVAAIVDRPSPAPNAPATTAPAARPLFSLPFANGPPAAIA